MKYFFISLIFFFASINTAFPNIETKVKSVIVFRNGAQITRTAQVNVVKGSNNFMFYGIPDVDQNTISVKLPNAIQVKSVSGKRKDETIKDDFTKSQERRISEIRNIKDLNEIILATYKDEESLIIGNKILNTSQNGVNAESLSKMADLYRSRLLAVREKVFSLTKKSDSLDTEIQTIQNNINSHFKKQSPLVLSVDAFSDQIGSFEVTISYLDYRANWSSSYAFRLSQLNQPILLDNTAMISQNTGELWENISLALATGDPRRSFNAPVLSPWFLQYIQQIQPLGNEISVRGSRSNENVYFLDGVRVKDQSNVRTIQDLDPTIRENITYTQFNIPYLVSIESVDKGKEITLKTDTINSHLQYYCVPSMNNRVFLKAGLIDWNKYNLTSGEVKIYFENTYTGTTFLNASTSEDTLQISLGQDIAILCETKKIKSFKKNLTLSSKKELTETKEFTIRNNKSYEIKIEIQERIPISTDKDMEVVLLESSGGVLNKETGIITWNAILKPGEKTSKQWSYAVTIPKSKNIQL